ncbi:MAG: hypothetical protein LUC35_06565, partial [Clostridiales bacterium]|nr:hypothetical protein [Clostridiales bacterium]
MKQRAMKKGLSALCLALALCMTFQSATLAVDLSADTSASISSASEGADNAEGDASLSEEEANAQDEADTSAEEEEAEEAAAPAEEEAEEAADPVEEEAEEAADPAEEEAEDAADPAEEEAEEAADSVEEEAAEEEDEADVTVFAQATTSTDTGWTYVSNSYWTFYYKENSTATAAAAADTVLYIPGSSTSNSTTFEAGYYYFDADGKLVADGTTASVGAVEVLVASSDDGSYVCNTSAANSGKVMEVVTTMTTASSGTVTVSSSATAFTGQYSGDGLWYYQGAKFTGYVRRYSSDYVWKVTNGKGGTKFTGKMSTSTAYVRMDTGTKSVGDGLYYYSGAKFTGYIRNSSSDSVWVVTDGVLGSKLTGQMSKSTAYVRMDTAKKSTGDGLWYYNGTKYTGYARTSSTGILWYVKNGVGGTRFTGQMSKSTAYVRMDT